MNETQRALMEGARNAACDKYFDARPQIDTNDMRLVFEAGFSSAWKELLPTQCDCTTSTHPDGKQETYCSSDQMTREIFRLQKELDEARTVEELCRKDADFYQDQLWKIRSGRDDSADLVTKALRKAWQLGQTYWQQADSEYVSQHKKADVTQAKFQTLVDETRTAILADVTPNA